MEDDTNRKIILCCRLEEFILYLNSPVVFPTFFNLNLNLAIRSSWSVPQSAPSLVLADCIELLRLGCKEYNQSDFGVDHLVMSMCRVYARRLVTLCRRQESRPSPRKRNAKEQNGYLRRPYKQLWKEEKWKGKEKRKDISIWIQSSKE